MIASIEGDLNRLARRKQREIYDEILEKVLLSLETDDLGNIRNNTKNNNIIRRAAKIFKNSDLKDLAKLYAGGLDDIFESTNKQFSNYGDVDKAFRDRTENRIKENLGIVSKKIAEGSFLDSTITLQPLKQKVSNELFKATSGAQNVETLLDNIKTISLGNDKKDGVLESHINTFLNDTVNQVSNSVSSSYADEFGFDAFFYQGTTITTTRDFCKERQGKVITREEAMKWGTSSDDLGGYTNKSQGQFAGKNANYNPLVDIGGHNCRHHLDWIPNELAVQLRSDLIIRNGRLFKVA